MPKKIYFLSDFHLGVPTFEKSLEREKRIVQFLNEVQSDMSELFLLGDMFDFWYEYKKVVPRGHTRILGKLAEITDSGIPVHFFVGNHDMWMKDYFQQELNILVYFEPKTFYLQDKKLLIGHGDGLGPGDIGYKRLKKIFRNPFCQWAFGMLPPRIGIGLADYFSGKSRGQNNHPEVPYTGDENEFLVQYCKKKITEEHFDYFIFGHRHLPIDFKINETSRYINLGEWMNFATYAEMEEGKILLKSYIGKDDKIYRN